MSGENYNQADIERDEQWLASIVEDEMLECGEALLRVKAAVRANVEPSSVDADAQERLTRIKGVVRDELTASSNVEQVTLPPVFRPFAPLLVAAAAVAFAFLGISGGAVDQTGFDPDIAIFVQVMGDEGLDVTETDELLDDLVNDVAYLESSSFVGGIGGELDVLLDEVERVLDGEMREGAS